MLMFYLYLQCPRKNEDFYGSHHLNLLPSSRLSGPRIIRQNLPGQNPERDLAIARFYLAQASGDEKVLFYSNFLMEFEYVCSSDWSFIKRHLHEFGAIN